MTKNAKQMLGHAFIFLSGGVLGALVCVLLWRSYQHAYEMMVTLVVTLAATLWMGRQGYQLATGKAPRPVGVIIAELRDVLANEDDPARAHIPTWAQLGPIFGALMALWVLVVTTFGDGRPFVQ